MGSFSSAAGALCVIVPRGSSFMSDQDISGIGMCLYFRAILSAGRRTEEANIQQILILSARSGVPISCGVQI